jgi:hypothetical protein
VNGVTTLRRLPPLIVAAVSVGFLQVLADAVHRSGWEGVSRGKHVAAALLLHATVATLLTLIVASAFALYRRLERRVAARWEGARRLLLPLVSGAVGAIGIAGTAFWTFSGERVRGTSIAMWGPWVVIGLAAALAAAGAVVLRRIVPSIQQSSAGVVVAIATVLLLAAASLVKMDLNLYVSLYSRLHTFLEASAAVCAFAATSLFCTLARRGRPLVERAMTVFAGVAGVLTAAFVFIEPLRAKMGDALRHAWREPVYVGRMLSRVQIVEGFVRDPRGWRGATMSSVVRLRERYDIATTARSPIWDGPFREAPALKQKLAELRGSSEPNVVVFYVDTLRADVARDPRVMPNTVHFASQNLDFRHAYTTGSDTLHALPGIMGGSYDLFARQRNDLLRVARGAGYHSVLLVAQSAHEFLSKLLPDFIFEETVKVPDYASGNENVWGYGADQPTAARLVDRSLDWIREHRGGRFLLWTFNFDLHNWRELDEAYVRQAGKQFGLLDESDPVWRYRVVARSVDVQLGRLLDGLRDLDAERDTVVLFVSDHGEGLGREGFWVHSVYLWESLVHVPLILRVPGVPAARVDDVVSLVDVAPTLARLMAHDAETILYQGEDLLSYLVPDHPQRRLPLVLMGTLKEVPVRLGIIDTSGDWKLVLPLEGAVPELYDLHTGDPDARDVSGEHRPDMLRLLNELVRAPLFPRLSEAGNDSALDQAAVDGQTAIEHDAAEAKAAAAAAEQAAKEAKEAKEAKAKEATGAPPSGSADARQR